MAEQHKGQAEAHDGQCDEQESDVGGFFEVLGSYRYVCDACDHQ